MKIFRLLPFLPGLILSTALAGQDAPSGLMVEFIRQPAEVPILDLNPEFSWVVPAGSCFQKAYRIVVISAGNCSAAESVIWDSGRVTTGNSTEVGYGGKQLSPVTCYAWKVMIWDDSDRPSPFSDLQKFSAGNHLGYITTRNRFMETHISPSVFYVSGEESYFADFGKDAFGTLLLDLDFVTDDTILVRLGEKLTAGGAIDRNPGGSIRCQEVLLPVKQGRNQYTLPLKSDARNTGPAAIALPDSFGVIMPFRYCELEKCRIPVKPQNLLQKAFWYYFNENASSFSSSDSVLNKVWDISKYSIKATSFAGIYVDGDRERIPYEADAYIDQLGHYYTDREYSIARLTNEYLIKHPTWPTEWLLHTIPLFYNDYLFTGNTESVRQYYDELRYKTLIALARPDGLISASRCTPQIIRSLGFSDPEVKVRDIVDWPPAQKDTGWKLATAEGERDGYDMREINTVVNAFYIHDLYLMSELAGAVDKSKDSLLFREKADSVLETFNNKLLDTKKGFYVDGEGSEHSSLHANMIPLALGLVPEKFKKSVVEFIKTKGMACSVYGAQYLLEGLYNAGEADYALSLLTALHDRSWWNMIKSGSTIAMEAWDIKYKPNTDWNHAWGAAPANIILGMMWGIGPSKAGYSAAVIKPQLSSLKYSSIDVPTIRGNIHGEYSRKKNRDEYIIEIPGNMRCIFIVTEKGNYTVSINNKKWDSAQAVINLNPGTSRIVVEKSSMGDVKNN
jgi:hypothetical protein